nr:HPr family phosphocarrier protein [Spelaeicoccus albus]
MQMAGDSPPPIEVAAGSGDGFGTEATAIADAIGRVDSPDGVLVLMDLGSAVLNAEMALELSAPSGPVRLTPAPLVEGLVAAVVSAVGGAGLAAVDAEARRGLMAKEQHLGNEPGSGPGDEPGDELRDGSESTAPDAEAVQADVRVTGRDGLHARPAAALVRAVSKFRATVTVSRPGGQPASASSVSALAALDVRLGDVVRVSATGDDAQAAVDEVVRLAALDDGHAGDDASAQDNESGSEVAVGPAVFQDPPNCEPPAAFVERDDRPAERDKVSEASRVVADVLAERAGKVDGDVSTILRADAAMAGDPAFVRAAHQFIDADGVSAPAAVWRAAQTIIDALSHGRLAERAADLVGVRDRMIAELAGRDWPGLPTRDFRFVLIADDLTPADAAELDASTCAAVVTVHGGPKSHTAIIARGLGIPAVSNADLPDGLTEGMMVRVDAGRQSVTLAE